jgi:hypothetical protein
MKDEPTRSPTYVAAEEMLPPNLHPVLKQLVMEYQFAALKHTGQSFSNAKVLAELILMGWRTS